MRFSTALLSFLLLLCASPAMGSPVLYEICFSYDFGGETMQGPLLPGGKQVAAGIPVAAPIAEFYYDPSAPDNGNSLYAFSAPSGLEGGLSVIWSVSINLLNVSMSGSPACASGQTGDAAIFTMLTNCPGATTGWTASIPDDYWGPFSLWVDAPGGSVALAGSCYCFGNPQPLETSVGSFTVTTAPEPATTLPMIGGLVCLFRKRIAHLGPRRHTLDFGNRRR